MIQTTSELIAFVERARETDAVAIDTEFVWERTYFPQLGLIQVALSDEDCELIDPIAIEDLSPLGELLSDRNVVKILHDAPQDLAILYQATGTAAQNVFDTRLAAGFADLPSTLSLCNLIKELLDINLSKTETRTNWLQRPLKEQQVEYALDDVRYLRAVRVILMSRIIGPKIKSWLQEELNLLNNPKNYIENGQSQRYRKIRGAGSLNRQSLSMLQMLSAWREETAKELNRPRGHIVKDNVLVAISKKKIMTPEELHEKSGLSIKASKKYGEAICQIINEVRGADESSYPDACRTTRLTTKERETLDTLSNLIQLKCKVLGIDPALVGNGSELKELVKVFGNRKRQIKQLRQTEGWRKKLLDDFFRQHR
ncbi:ribonuclease D [Desulfopila sp. IMCC35008]|uniref:ribonuclease D n=1 Tax=Desulfopila sp. IMCC35008 TaxID=2653858 RepID=UPI0013D7332E|nr:ribonuclease D [Desulfopila sp. IMCC35008]